MLCGDEERIILFKECSHGWTPLGIYRNYADLLISAKIAKKDKTVLSLAVYRTTLQSILGLDKAEPLEFFFVVVYRVSASGKLAIMDEVYKRKDRARPISKILVKSTGLGTILGVQPVTIWTIDSGFLAY